MAHDPQTTGAAPPAARAGDPDFALLNGAAEYTRYFNLLHRVWQTLNACYRLRQSDDSFEAHRVEEYLERLVFTVESLRMKYAHNPAYRRQLWIDLTDSGFPNHQEIESVATALRRRKERLRELPSAALTKQLMLDHLFRQHEDPADLLAQMAERAYLEMLAPEKLFLPFVISRGGLSAEVPAANGGRSYRASWGCYDFKTNRPYLHVMTFDQDAHEDPLTPGSGSAEVLEQVLRAEGSRAPDVALLAMMIDEAVESIHPKILKRICLGPLHTRRLLHHQDMVELDEKHRTLLDLLASYGDDDDFILFVTEEIAISKRQEISHSLFAPHGKVREIFLIPETDPECYRRRASVVHKHVVMPHTVAQHVDDGARERVPEIENARILTYDERGDVHGI